MPRSARPFALPRWLPRPRLAASHLSQALATPFAESSTLTRRVLPVADPRRPKKQAKRKAKEEKEEDEDAKSVGTTFTTRSEMVGDEEEPSSEAFGLKAKVAVGKGQVEGLTIAQEAYEKKTKAIVSIRLGAEPLVLPLKALADGAADEVIVRASAVISMLVSTFNADGSPAKVEPKDDECECGTKALMGCSVCFAPLCVECYKNTDEDTFFCAECYKEAVKVKFTETEPPSPATAAGKGIAALRL